MSGGMAMTARLAGDRRVASMIVVPVLLAAVLVVSTVRVTSAYAATYCGSRHVTVIVDFTKLHGSVKSGCDRRLPANGLAALTKAGFTYTFVPRQPGFICTIDHRPRTCNGAPTSAYWSYWHARPHGKWTYSKLGAGSYHPKAGWVEGWAFGNGKPPRIPPP